jgi:pimeloyl-ACP methyl ester carboxylesterase
MAEENRKEFGAALQGSAALESFLETASQGMHEQRADTIVDALGGLVTEVDRRALDGPLAGYLATSLNQALSTGIWGWHDDDLAFARDWGFPLERISVPVAVWQGRRDAMVPYAHGAWLGEQVPGARARLFEDEGHLSLTLRFDEIVDELVGTI